MLEGVKMEFQWNENVKIDVRDLQGNLIDTTQFHNQVHDPGLNYLAKSLASSTFDMKIRYLAWGSSSSTGSNSDTVMSTEGGRKAVTSAATSNTGVVYTVVYLSPTEATTNIKELAWFASSSATAVAGTGTMISRVIYDRTKTALESITITRTDTFSTG